MDAATGWRGRKDISPVVAKDKGWRCGGSPLGAENQCMSGVVLLLSVYMAIPLFAAGLICGLLLVFAGRPLIRRVELLFEKAHKELVDDIKDRPAAAASKAE